MKDRSFFGALALGGGGLMLWNSLSDKQRTRLIDFGATALNNMAQPSSPVPLPILPSPEPVLLPEIKLANPQPLKLPLPEPIGLQPELKEYLKQFSGPEHLARTTIPIPLIEPDAKLRDLIVHPSVVLISGKRGSGKSALAYRILELNRNSRTPIAVGIPVSATSLLPDWIGVAASLEDVPAGSIVVVDEAHLTYHSRNSGSAANRAISKVLNLSRQNDLTIIFVTQETRQIDRNIASAANVLIFKEPSMLQAEFERKEFRQLIEKAATAFSGLSDKQKKRTAYIFSPDADFDGAIETELPSFWSSRLSKAFAKASTSSATKPRPAKKLTRAEKQKRARELREAGWKQSAIAAELGVSKSTVVNYLKGYPYGR